MNNSLKVFRLVNNYTNSRTSIVKAAEHSQILCLAWLFKNIKSI